MFMASKLSPKITQAQGARLSMGGRGAHPNVYGDKIVAVNDAGSGCQALDGGEWCAQTFTGTNLSP